MSEKKILIVDDEESFTRLLKLNLEQTGRYRVRVVNWAEDTVMVAREFRPDMILLDVMMPRMFGGDVAAQIQADPCLKGTAIGFLTAALSRTRVEEHDGLISGFQVLAKPVNVAQVIAFVEKHLSAP
jgi:CheY-like chemotaxis protein